MYHGKCNSHQTRKSREKKETSVALVRVPPALLLPLVSISCSWFVRPPFPSSPAHSPSNNHDNHRLRLLTHSLHSREAHHYSLVGFGLFGLDNEVIVAVWAIFVSLVERSVEEMNTMALRLLEIGDTPKELKCSARQVLAKHVLALLARKHLGNEAKRW